MGRFLLLSLLIAGLVLAGLASLNGTLLALALPLLVYLATGLLFDPAEPQVEVTRTISADRAGPGAPITVRLVLANRGGRLAELTLADDVPAELTLAGGQP